MDILTWFFELSLLTQLIIIYFIVINILTFFYFGFDKLQARLQNRRIRERTLWILMIIGGCPGAFAAMEFFHHKTRKMSFQIIAILILLVQIAVFFLLI